MKSAEKSPAAIFKIFRADEWEGFQQSGQFAGSADDLRDGFIHLSTATQLAGTVARHFAGEKGLIAAELALDGDPALRWEASRDGALFPHLYRRLGMDDVNGWTTLDPLLQ